MFGANIGEWGNGLCGFGTFPGHGFFGLGWIFPILFWGFVIYLVFKIFQDIFGSGKNKKSDSALETLRNRFAMGEINEQEYNSKKAALTSK